MAYVYQEYPRHVHRADGMFTVVTNDAEKAAALADGWCLLPFTGALPPAVEQEAPVVLPSTDPRPRRKRDA